MADAFSAAVARILLMGMAGQAFRPAQTGSIGCMADEPLGKEMLGWPTADTGLP
jgi:hypothetical protein